MIINLDWPLFSLKKTRLMGIAFLENPQNLACALVLSVLQNKGDFKD